MGGHKAFSDSLRPIPGYGGAYSITPEGVVVNQHNKVLKTFSTRQGEAIELRYQGQRERVLIADLLKRLEDPHANSGAD
jgi:hypothetical protein